MQILALTVFHLLIVVTASTRQMTLDTAWWSLMTLLSILLMETAAKGQNQTLIGMQTSVQQLLPYLGPSLWVLLPTSFPLQLGLLQYPGLSMQKFTPSGPELFAHPLQLPPIGQYGNHWHGPLILASYFRSFNLIIAITFLSLTNWLTRAGAFLLYCCLGALGWVIFFLFLPETSGKSLEEMEELFSGPVVVACKKKTK